MLRSICSALSRAPLNLFKNNVCMTSVFPRIQSNEFSTLNNISARKPFTDTKPVLVQTPLKTVDHIVLKGILPQLNLNPCRTFIIKVTKSQGTRRSCRDIPKRFFRLHWGAWIRTIAGRHKRLWKKSSSHKRRLRQHVFLNSTQCTLLDNMVSPYWKKRKYYVDDIYEPYHTREEFELTRKKPIYNPPTHLPPE